MKLTLQRLLIQTRQRKYSQVASLNFFLIILNLCSNYRGRGFLFGISYNLSILH